MKNKKNVEKIVYTCIITTMMILTFSFTALASNTYAENGAKWLLDGVFWIVAVGGIFGAGMSAIKRNATGAVGIILAAAIICVFCKNPDVLTNIGNVLKGILGL
jgi:hypothetical protein